MSDTASRPSPPVSTLRSAQDAAALRAWALAEIASGRPTAALDAIHAITCEPEGGDVRLGLDLGDEITVRAAIALDDPDLLASLYPPGEEAAAVFSGTALFAPPDDDDTTWADIDVGLDEGADPPGDSRAVAARAIGAHWLLERREATEGPQVRFRDGHGLLAAARWGLASAISGGELAPAVRDEAEATLNRLCAGSFRETDGARAIRMADRAPKRLRHARGELRRVRRGGMTVGESLTRLAAATQDIAAACEPRWPALGGPWWTSRSYGVSFDVSAPTNERGRHRLATADVFLELDDAEIALALAHDAPAKGIAHILVLADLALGHAVQSGLAGEPC